MAIDWTTRLDTMRAKKLAAESALTDEDKAEIAARAEESKLEEEMRDAEETARGLSLARRFDAARDALGPTVPLKSIQVKGSSHNFIIKNAGAAAYNAWEKGISASITASMTGDAKVDRAAVSRAFAVAAVHDWNGETDFSGGAENGAALIDFFKANPAIAADVVNVAVELAKAAKEARKSTR